MFREHDAEAAPAWHPPQDDQPALRSTLLLVRLGLYATDVLRLRRDDFDPDLPERDFTTLAEAAWQNHLAGWKGSPVLRQPRAGQASTAA
ncbi:MULTISPECIES: hypothetical protein [unclassified Nonomuraea]|uniref:hypothetical protein n=1 Tax=unclassified Nonomuraea TaxID=2593643 RepID=UPI0034000E45